VSSQPRACAAIVFVTLFVSYAWFFQGGGFNPNSRLALTRALAESGTLTIDAYPHTGDWAEFDGHRYSNKAPAFSFLAAPIWRLVAGDVHGDELSLPAWVVNVLLNALPSALLGVLIIQCLGQVGIEDPPLRALTSLCYGLGTLAFPYATALYAHQPAAVASFAAFAWLVRPQPTRAGAALAGAAAGLAVTLELSAGLVAIILGLWLLAARERRALCLPYIAGGVPFALALAAYNAAAFGSPFDFWFEHANPGVEVRVDGQLFGLPNPITALELLVLPYRGLLLTSPVLLLALFGWRRLRRAAPAAALLCAAIPLAFLALVSSFHAWYGGWAPGARYLVPALPFLCLPLAHGIARWTRCGAVLGGLSVACMLAFTATAVEVPAGFAIPLLDFAWPHLLDGQIAVNPQTLDALYPPDAYAAGGGPRNDASFNLGELFFARGLASLLPLLAVWAAAALLLARQRRPAGASNSL
jgi:hypothetical protein